MMAQHIPAQPLLVVLGSTGTGKSALAVELAKRFRGEIINSDAMQLYNGLPILTNKVTLEEQKGIPHHLLGHISLQNPPWNVTEYKREATEVIAEIRARGNIPIVVGGTQYYIDPLLFPDVILDEVQQTTDSSEIFTILQQPTEVLLEELRKYDPIMAERWHPNDRRRITRSLEIYLHTGKPASQIYAEQEARKAAAPASKKSDAITMPWEKLLFWVYSDKEVLCERLDRRVDKMCDEGLLDEVRSLYTFKQKMNAQGVALDMTKGIFQSIGYKQFEPYLEAVDAGQDAPELEKLNLSALESTKAATRRYANYQNKWIRLKQIRRLRDQGVAAVQSLYVLDSTDVSKFEDNVVEPAADLTAKFLSGQERPAAVDVSDLARQVLDSALEPPPQAIHVKRTCEICQTVLVTEEAWQRHVKSSGHRKVMKRKQRRALVLVDKTSSAKGELKEGDDGSDTPDSSRSRASTPDLGCVFSSDEPKEIN
ncbi:hypothetical protein E4U60_001172 [Claviceps pazoutovae]|uniref:tRNA dimethylallyltransferase n=1 Tax=Claviceps pazoutovae TaxID=1649127 RepID=A0A9P7MDK5_9HYPO|nr:hypothetical protein E4U60_001172 [Claviceps pazoutovae]